MKKKIILIVTLLMCLAFTLGVVAVYAEDAQNLPVATEETETGGAETDGTENTVENENSGENENTNGGEENNGSGEEENNGSGEEVPGGEQGEKPIDKDELLKDLIAKVDGLIAEKNNEGLDKLWEVIRPFVVYVLSALLSGTIVAGFISKAISKKYDTKAIAKSVVEDIANKDISVDLETMTRKEIMAIGTALKANLQDGLAGVENMRRSVALLCNALSKSKTLTQEERDELAAEAKKLDETVQAESKEKVVVRLEKSEVNETTANEAQGGLFDHLGK